MKRVVSVSLGSSTRNKTVEITLMGEKISIQRIGTDGNEKSAKKLFEELDGKVDALGVGGIDLTVGTLSHSFPILAAYKLIENVKNTPVVDGRGLKHTLEYKAVQYMTDIIGPEINPKRAMVTSALDRYGMASGFVDAGYDMTFCDFMFGLNIPVPVKSMKYEDFLISLMAPVVSRLPIKYLYPTGDKQLERIPRFKKWYDWATVVAGDSIYILKHMPDLLQGKVIFTNTTTVDDYETFKTAGVKYLVTTTPRYDGRSFGTNVLEAALIAVSGKKRLLDTDELSEMIAVLNLHPIIEKLY
jgi:hypothetical protein